jgi:hypothetical protein
MRWSGTCATVGAAPSRSISTYSTRVTPTIEVPFDPVYAAGRDPQLDRAVQVLSDRIKG